MRRVRFGTGLSIVWALIAAGCANQSETLSADTTAAVQQAGTPGTAVDSLFERGRQLYADGQFDSARTTWTRALRGARSVRDLLSEARLLTEIAFALRKVGALDSARSVADSALALKRRIGADARGELSRSLNLLGLIALSDNRNPDAAALFEQAIAAAAEVADAEGVAKATGNAGLAYAYLGDLRRARAGHQVLRRAGRDLGNAYYEANGLANEAMVDIAEGDAPAALARLDTARELYRRAPMERAAGEQNALLQMATAYELTGNYAGAFAAFDTALALARAHDLKEQEIALLRLLGGVHRRIGDHRRALRYYAQSETLARAQGIRADLAATLRGAAESHALAGNLARAVANAEEAYRLHTASDEMLEQVEDLLLLAELEGRLRRPTVARRLALADSLARASDVRLTLIQTALARARDAERRAQPRATLRALAEVDLIARELDFESAWTAAAFAARAYARLGLLDSAAFEGRRAILAIERLRGQLSLEPLRTSLLAERADVYGDHILVLLRLGRTDEAFQVSDRARSRALLERLASMQESGAIKQSGFPRDLVEGEKLLRRIDTLLSALRRGPAPRQPPRGGAGEIRDTVWSQLSAARAEYEALLMRAGRSDARATAMLGAAAPTLLDIQRTLREDEALLEYFIGREELLTFVVRRQSLHVLRRPTSHESLAQRARLVRDLWSAAPDKVLATDGLEVARSLHADLIAPADSTGALEGVARLIVVPHGVLAQLPFAGMLNRTTGRFVVETHALAYAPSAAGFAAARVQPPEAEQTRGTAGFAPFPRELPASGGEVRAFAASVATRRENVHLGESATESALRDALARASVVHVATHGVMNAANPLFSRIELTRGSRRAFASTDDGRLEVRELLAAPVRASLVFLSGCETGAMQSWLNAPVRGSGELSLSQAFLVAGARNVISTLWTLDDAPAAVFAKAFYDDLRRMSAADALARAQRQLIADPRTRAPYFWAAYVLSGEGTYSIAQKPSAASVY